MNEDGRIGFVEAKAYTKVTDGEDCALPLDAWGFVCKYAGSKADPKVGLTFIQFRKTFLDKYTANLLETDLDHDYQNFVNFARGSNETNEDGAIPTNEKSKVSSEKK